MHAQRGGTFLGFILGLVVGLGVALGVAIYVMKVPTPFSNKMGPSSSETSGEGKKDWNPNSVLQPKAPAETPQATGDASTNQGTTAPASAPAASPATQPATSSAAPGPASKPAAAPAVSADPLGDLAASQAGMSTSSNEAKPAVDPYSYYIQVGAFRTNNDADAMRAKLALQGFDAKVSEREQAGRTVYRVRLGPFDNKAGAETMRSRLDKQGIENTLVRVQR
jgi:cell division protein FtsN